jgi:proline dehydrogenase
MRPGGGQLTDRAAQLTAAVLDPLRRRRVAAYRAGADLDEALAVTRRLAAFGLAATIGYTAKEGESPRAVAAAHLAAFERLSHEAGDCQVSVKLSALAFDAELLAELDAAAARSSRTLHVDALGPETVDLTLRLLDAPRRSKRGTTLPGRWQRSVDDAEPARRLGLRVRVVKGQWADAGHDGVDPASGFLRVVDALRGHRHGVAVATHDVALLAESLQRLTASGTPCSAELFLGLPFRGPALAARRLGVPIRVYVPYGHGGAPYGVADVAAHPVAAWWLLQDVVLGRDKTWRSIRRSRAHL